MYKIDFTPPSSKDSKKENKEFLPHPQREWKSLLKSKIVWGGLVFSLAVFLIGSTYIGSTIKEETTHRVYSDVEFMGNKKLGAVYNLDFESDTAQSIYNIEYQNHAINSLKAIVSLIGNDIETIKNVLPSETKGNLEIEIMNAGDSQVLLISSEGVSSIKKYPIVANFAIHFKDGEAQKIQSFFYTADEFIIEDKLGLSTFANWHKKTLLVVDKEVSIFEANLKEPVIAKKEPLIIEDNETVIITEADEKIGNAQIGEETEDNDENLTAQDLEDHESIDEPEEAGQENQFFLNSHNH